MAATYWQAHITPTTRQAGPGQEWTRWDAFSLSAPTKDALRKKLGDYGTPRQPIYRDQANGSPVKVGHIYTSKEREDGKTYYRQNWVTIVQVTEETRI